MKIYLVSLAAGIFVGLIYALLQVRSPAPPAIALVGLLGMLVGEQALPIARKMLAREPVSAAWLRADAGKGAGNSTDQSADKPDAGGGLA